VTLAADAGNGGTVFIGVHRRPIWFALERIMNLKPNTPPVNANKKSRLFEPVA